MVSRYQISKIDYNKLKHTKHKRLKNRKCKKITKKYQHNRQKMRHRNNKIINLFGGAGNLLPEANLNINLSGAPVKDGVIIKKLNFIESQESLGCGRHALNNLLMNKVFTKGSFGKALNIGNMFSADKKSLKVKLPIPLSEVCKYLTNNCDYFGADYCQDTENYDINVLKYALGIIGYYVGVKWILLL